METRAANVRLATGPVSWGIDFPDAPANPPWRQVLDEIGRSGYRWTELGPLGYLPDDAVLLRAELAGRSLQVAGSFLFQPLHDAMAHGRVMDAAHRTLRTISSIGGRFVVVIDAVSDERAASAGRPDAARRLAGAELDTLLEGVEAVAELARSEYELRPVLHPHAGSFVEFEDEIDAVIERLDPSLIEICLDTGHCAYSGIDPVALYRRYSERIPYLHLKDVDGGVRARALERRLGFWEAVYAGIFCPLGSGVVDFAGLAVALGETGFDGWATVEQDRDPAASSDALADVIESREFLERTGVSGNGGSLP